MKHNPGARAGQKLSSGAEPHTTNQRMELRGALGVAILGSGISGLSCAWALTRAGYRILEVPTEWTDKIGSKVTLFRTSLTMFLSVVRIRLIYSPFYNW